MKKEDQAEYELELVRKAAGLLAEHFECVQIFASRHEPKEGDTVRITHGTGNWFARYGQVREWCLREEEDSRAIARRDYHRHQSEDDDESSSHH